MIEALRRANPALSLVALSEQPQHRLYRKADVDPADFIALAKKLEPQSDNVYIALDEQLTATEGAKRVQRTLFAELPMQAGWCFGGNSKMNGMEWHKSSEVIIACTDLVLLLGDFMDVCDESYASCKAFGLYLKRGEAVELMPMTLHLAPLPVTGGRFIASILLPKSTNTPLAGGIDGMLRAVNKWLLVHEDNEKGVRLGGKIGIAGENIVINGI